MDLDEGVEFIHSRFRGHAEGVFDSVGVMDRSGSYQCER